MLKQNGYTNSTKTKLFACSFDVNEAYIKSIKEAGFTNIDLITFPFKALNIDKAYIDEIRKAGYKDISRQDHNIESPGYRWKVYC
jgi:hypothetical protein